MCLAHGSDPFPTIDLEAEQEEAAGAVVVSLPSNVEMDGCPRAGVDHRSNEAICHEISTIIIIINNLENYLFPQEAQVIVIINIYTFHFSAPRVHKLSNLQWQPQASQKL